MAGIRPLMVNPALRGWNWPPQAQETILRAVEYGSFERVGSSRPTSVDVRIIGATNADLPALARAGRFKEDLLDRPPNDTSMPLLDIR